MKEFNITRVDGNTLSISSIDEINDLFHPIITWLDENCHEYSFSPIRGRASSGVIFKREEWIGYRIKLFNNGDAVAFKLTWSSSRNNINLRTTDC